MKKRLLRTMLLLFALIAGSGSVWADITSPWSHTFSTTDKTFTEDGTETLSGVDWTLAVTWAGTSSDYNKDTKGMKIGSNNKKPNSMTLSTSDIPGRISSVSVTTCGKSGSSCSVGVTVGDTDFTTEDSWGAGTSTKMTFTGSASGDIVISWDQSSSTDSNKGALYVTDIEVVFSASGKERVGAITISPADGTIFKTETQDVTISCATADATISYTLNGGASQIYSGPFTISETTTIVATASKDGMEDNTATATLTQKLPPVGLLLAADYDDWTVASSSSTDYVNKYGTWKGVKMSKEVGYAKLGSSSAAGSVTTPAFGLACDATLTFKAKRYSASETSINVTIDGGGSISGDTEITDLDADFATYTVSITDATADTKVTIGTPTKRAYVDEIAVVATTGKAIISEAGYATFVAPVAVDFSATSLEIYTAQVNGAKNGVTLTAVESKKVPAGAAVILKGATATGAVIASADALENNDLEAGPVTGDGASHYALGKDGEKVGFGILADGTALPANKAYIAASKFATNAPAFMPFSFGETTGIKAIDNGQLTIDNAVYNLNGQRVAQPSKGLYIVNGRKVAIK